jgi:hypothetical protein
MSKTKDYKVAHDAYQWGTIGGAAITVVLDLNLVGTVTNIFY